MPKGCLFPGCLRTCSRAVRCRLPTKNIAFDQILVDHICLHWLIGLCWARLRWFLFNYYDVNLLRFSFLSRCWEVWTAGLLLFLWVDVRYMSFWLITGLYYPYLEVDYHINWHSTIAFYIFIQQFCECNGGDLTGSFASSTLNRDPFGTFEVWVRSSR